MREMIKGFIKDFKEFFDSNDFFSVAIGVLIAGAIKDLTMSFFNNLISPIINYLMTISGLQKSASDSVKIFGIDFGISAFFSSLFSFFVLILIIFFIMKISTQLTHKSLEDNDKKSETDYLEEILIELKKLNGGKDEEIRK